MPPRPPADAAEALVFDLRRFVSASGVGFTERSTLDLCFFPSSHESLVRFSGLGTGDSDFCTSESVKLAVLVLFDTDASNLSENSILSGSAG